MLEPASIKSKTQNHDVQDENSELTKVYDSQPYTAYTEDLEFMWRWTIYRDEKLIQEGCSLTFEASRRSVNHVMAFFNMSNKHNTVAQEL